MHSFPFSKGRSLSQMIWWYVVGALIALLSLLLFTRITFEVRYGRLHSDDRLIFHVRALFGLVRFRREISTVRFKNLLDGLILQQESSLNGGLFQQQNDGQINLQKLRKAYRKFMILIRHTKGFSEWSKELLKQIECTRFIWTTRIGLGEAPLTAVAVGTLWSLKTTMLRFLLQRFKKSANPELKVIPEYRAEFFSTELSASWRMVLGKAVLGVPTLLLRILRAKAGLKAWRKTLLKTQ